MITGCSAWSSDPCSSHQTKNRVTVVGQSSIPAAVSLPEWILIRRLHICRLHTRNSTFYLHHPYRNLSLLLGQRGLANVFMDCLYGLVGLLDSLSGMVEMT